MATVGKVLRSFWWLISPYLTIYRIRLRGREPRDVDVSLTLCSFLDYAKNKAVASDAHVALISTIKRWNSKHKKKAMIWQTDRTSWPYRWNFVCFDSVLSARMMKGCAPDHAQVWAAQRKRACENQVKKVTCLLGNGGRKIIWKPVTQKKARDFAKVRVLLMWIRTRWLRRVRRWPIIRNRKLKELIELEVCGCFADSCFFWHRIIYEETPTDGFPDNRHIGLR